VVLLSSWTWVRPFYSLKSPFFWVLWFIYDWQGFIMLMVGILVLNGGKVLVLKFGFG
jgi:hypothetical protein